MEILPALYALAVKPFYDKTELAERLCDLCG